MARTKDTTSFESLLLQFIGMEDPMLSMLEWVCSQLMEAEVNQQLGAAKHE